MGFVPRGLAFIGVAVAQHEGFEAFVGNLEFDRAGAQIADERFAASGRPLAPPCKVSLQGGDTTGEFADELRSVPAFRGDGDGDGDSE